MAYRIQIRRDTSENWENINPVLADGEVGYDKTNKVLKIGDGVKNWSELEPYIPKYEVKKYEIINSAVVTDGNIDNVLQGALSRHFYYTGILNQLSTFYDINYAEFIWCAKCYNKEPFYFKATNYNDLKTKLMSYIQNDGTNFLELFTLDLLVNKSLDLPKLNNIMGLNTFFMMLKKPTYYFDKNLKIVSSTSPISNLDNFLNSLFFAHHGIDISSISLSTKVKLFWLPSNYRNLYKQPKIGINVNSGFTTNNERSAYNVISNSVVQAPGYIDFKISDRILSVYNYNLSNASVYNELYNNRSGSFIVSYGISYSDYKAVYIKPFGMDYFRVNFSYLLTKYNDGLKYFDIYGEFFNLQKKSKSRIRNITRQLSFTPDKNKSNYLSFTIHDLIMIYGSEWTLKTQVGMKYFDLRLFYFDGENFSEKSDVIISVENDSELNIPYGSFIYMI